MIKVSAGSASVLGLKKIQTDAECTTVYLLNGDRCTNNCGFCPQARESKANLKFLSRVIWPSFEDDEVIESIVNSYNKKQIKRVCIQSTSTADSFERCSKLIEIISAKCNVPISAAVNANTLERVEELNTKRSR
ncbi:hypothetical protein ACFIJ5_07220 [Haloimpatiens sp. FM7330]|uniref:hypothetical protein n=1 Tax=Haloimpatiens sp. FM7330 TaxID=3298610 RepID=UPI00363CC9FB